MTLNYQLKARKDCSKFGQSLYLDSYKIPQQLFAVAKKYPYLFSSTAPLVYPLKTTVLLFSGTIEMEQQLRMGKYTFDTQLASMVTTNIIELFTNALQFLPFNDLINPRRQLAKFSLVCNFKDDLNYFVAIKENAMLQNYMKLYEMIRII